MRIIVLVLLMAVSSSVRAQVMSGGGLHSVFVCGDGTAMACGYNMQGQIGDSTNAVRYLPKPVHIITNVIAVSAGTNYSLFLKSDGTVWGCGLNDNGQLGDGTIVDKPVPVKIATLSGITAISARGAHSIFLKSDGTVWACGSNNAGQIGDGTNTDRHAPVPIPTLSNITAIAGGAAHSLFLKSDGTVWSCGFNGGGELGDSSTLARWTPVPVKISGTVAVIAAGTSNASSGAHSLFIKSDGTVWGCGSNIYGQLGQGSTSPVEFKPIKINTLSGITAIAGGYDYSLFLKSDSTVWACGRNDNGSLGDSTIVAKSTPIQAHRLTQVVAINAGWFHSLFLKADGTIWSCGSNGSGQLGDGLSVTYRLAVAQVQQLCATTSIPHSPTIQSVSIAPNPSSGRVTISASSPFSHATLGVYNSQGKLVHQSTNHSGTAIIFDRQSLPAGIYFIRLTEPSKELSVVGKLVIAD